jgi:hypothetical protein
MESVFQRDMGCLHCRFNPKGIKPFTKNSFHNEELSQETKNMMAKMAKKENLPKECIFCSIMLFYWTKKLTYQ